MGDADQMIRDALRKAQAVLAEYLAPGEPNDHQTVKKLFGIPNDRAVIQALQQAEFPAQNPKRRQQLGDAP
jgi:hypothetical protein